jgi:hypothetical protein
MAEAPKSREQLEQEAMFVYVGRVGDVRETAGGPTAALEADVEVERTEKALLGPGETSFTLHFRRPGEREPGLTGDIGQHSPLPPGELVRLYVTYDGEGRAQLLEPNGWEPAS